MLPRSIILCLGFVLICSPLYSEFPPELRHYWDVVRPIMRTHCGSCHNAVDQKGGLNLVKYDFIVQIVRDGQLFSEVIETVDRGMMPPNTKPPLTQAEKDTLLTYLRKYLEDALAEPDPGIIPPRRLSNREYKYTMYDLLGVDINTDSLFPADASGGAGYDNQAKTLYLTPLQLERYFEVADGVIEDMYADPDRWNELAPPYKTSLRTNIMLWWKQLWGKEEAVQLHLRGVASQAIVPFATKAYRRLLRASEKDHLLTLFEEVYISLEAGQIHEKYDESLKEVFKAILISPHFIYRQEADLPHQGTYEISDFELASRISYLIWSSMPDQELLDLAYLDKLHEPLVLEQQVKRMLADAKASRLAESFAGQWLGVNKLLRPDFQLDPVIFPEYDPVMRDMMYWQTISFFQHVFLESQNLLELLDSDYLLLNEALAQVYNVPGEFNDELEVACLPDDRRGGVLGLGAVLTATSLPERTSPVLRGKWVLEQLLDMPPPPPPPDVPELEVSKDIHEELSLRALLEQHRSDPACSGCHKDMDALGLSLENFDAMGRWRDTYTGLTPIDARGILKTGEEFNGPGELRQVLMSKQEQFAEAFARNMLSFALGRSLSFTDSPTINHLTEVLIETDFHSITFLCELVKSFPFRYKKTDFLES